jgi:hypothetical protein
LDASRAEAYTEGEARAVAKALTYFGAPKALGGQSAARFDAVKVGECEVKVKTLRVEIETGPKFYDPANCRRKADQHWEMAGCARTDGDAKDEARHTDLAREWHRRARDGGWQEGDE